MRKFVITEKYVGRLEHNKSAPKPFFDGFNQLQKDVNFFFVYQMSKYCGENETSTIQFLSLTSVSNQQILLA